MENIGMREMLISISKLTRPEDLTSMKYFCKDVIPTRTREEIKTAVNLFEMLEERGKLKPHDLSFLERLLENTCSGRTDLIEILHNYKEEKYRSSAGTNIVDREKDEDLYSVFHFLAHNLGRNYLMILRRLRVPDSVLDQLVEENPRNVKEVIRGALKHWYQSNADSASRESIVQALRAERRNDLALKIAKNDI